MSLVEGAVVATNRYPVKFSLRSLKFTFTTSSHKNLDFDITASFWCNLSEGIDLYSIARKYLDLSPDLAEKFENSLSTEVRSTILDVSFRGEDFFGIEKAIDLETERRILEGKESIFSKVSACGSVDVPIKDAIQLAQDCLKGVRSGWRSFFTASDSRKIKLFDSGEQSIEARISIFVLPELEEILKMFRRYFKEEGFPQLSAIASKNPRSGDEIEIIPKGTGLEKHTIKRSGLGVALNVFTLLPKEKPVYEEKQTSIMLVYKGSEGSVYRRKKAEGDKIEHFISKEESLESIKNLNGHWSTRSLGLGLLVSSEAYSRARRDAVRWRRYLRIGLNIPNIGTLSLQSLLGKAKEEWEMTKEVLDKLEKDGAPIREVEAISRENGIPLRPGWEEEVYACYRFFTQSLDWMHGRVKELNLEEAKEQMKVNVQGKVVKVDVRIKESLEVATCIKCKLGSRTYHYTHLEWVGVSATIMHSI